MVRGPLRPDSLWACVSQALETGKVCNAKLETEEDEACEVPCDVGAARHSRLCCGATAALEGQSWGTMQQAC